MKKFVCQLSLFLTLSILEIAVIEIIARQEPNSYKAKETEMMKENLPYETIVVGSSHTAFGIDPRYLSMPSYNIANPSQRIYYDYHLLKRYIHHCPNIKYVICPISTFSPLTTKFDEESPYIINYELYMGFDEYPFYSKHNILILNTGNLITTLAKSILSQLGLHQKDYPFGFLDSYSISGRTQDWSDSQGAIRRHIKKYEKTKYEESLHYYIALANLCKQHETTLLFVTAPTHKNYYLQVPLKRRLLMRKLVEDVNKGTSCQIYYLDLLDDPRFTDEDFFDTDHMTCEYGAPKLTKIIDDYIKNIEATK